MKVPVELRYLADPYLKEVMLLIYSAAFYLPKVYVRRQCYSRLELFFL